MKTFFDAFKQKNMGAAYAYFYIHFATEVCCFYALGKLTGSLMILWLGPLIYDFLAFVPQGVIGYFTDKYPKFKPAIIGAVTMIAGLLLMVCLKTYYIPISIIALGNALIHVNGAEVTLRCSGGKLSHAAVFVAGGSFGVVTGKILAQFDAPVFLIIIAVLTAIPYMIYAERFDKEQVLSEYNYSSPNLKPAVIILFATLIVIVRGFMGYGIPTSWNKTILETVALYVAMGIGKGMGGILSDTIGMRKTALLSILFAIPFLVFGDNLMAVSLIGVCLFSMTMPVTLGLLVSVLKESPGIAFGFTTLGLFLGTLPIFFFKLNNTLANCIMIVGLSIICLIPVLFIIKKDKVEV